MSIRNELLILTDQILTEAKQEYEACRQRYIENCLAVFYDTLDDCEISPPGYPNYTDDMPDPRDYVPDTHGLILTIGVTLGANRELVSWGYQTGDNSYTGGAYGHKHWLVTYITYSCNTHEIVNDLMEQLQNIELPEGI
jgi:hypothetical protein